MNEREWRIGGSFRLSAINTSWSDRPPSRAVLSGTPSAAAGVAGLGLGAARRGHVVKFAVVKFPQVQRTAACSTFCAARNFMNFVKSTSLSAGVNVF
jgi:hypothetical protein